MLLIFNFFNLPIICDQLQLLIIQNYNMIGRLRILLCFLALLLIATAKIVQVPPVSSDEQISLRLSQLIEVDSSFQRFGNLSKIYKKEVLEIVNERETAFPACYQEPPETKFTGRAERYITDLVNRKGVIYNFDQIKYPRSLIDIAVNNLKIYYMLSSGKLRIDQMTNDYRHISTYKQQQSAEALIAQGNIVMMPNAFEGSDFGLFINQNQALLFNLETDEFHQITHYKKAIKFNSAIYLEAGYFAVAYASAGIKIFSVNFTDYTLNLEMDTQQVTDIDYEDIAYDSKRKILFMVDQKTGVSSLQISFLNGQVTTKLTSSSIKNSDCNLIYYDSYQDELYLSCRELHKYRISNWPMIDEKILPKQEISIRQIASTGQLVTLIGRDIFEVIFAGRKTAIYEDKLLDKLILTDKYFISANEYRIMLGTYLLIPPAIFCTTSNASAIGSHRVVLKVTAECNQDYFKSVGFNSGLLASDDHCVYSVYQTMQIWQPAKINTTPFLVVAILILILTAGILVWWVYTYVDLRRLRNSLLDYQTLEEENKGSHSDTYKDKEYNEASQGDTKKAGTTEKLNKEKIQDEIEMPDSNLHDIE